MGYQGRAGGYQELRDFHRSAHSPGRQPYRDSPRNQRDPFLEHDRACVPPLSTSDHRGDPHRMPPEHRYEGDSVVQYGSRADRPPLKQGSRPHRRHEDRPRFRAEQLEAHDSRRKSPPVRRTRAKEPTSSPNDVSSRSARAGFSKSARPLEESTKPPAGVVFHCSPSSKAECLRRMLFDMRQNSWTLVQRITEGTTIFLFDEASKEMHGVFEACTPGTFNLDQRHPQSEAEDGLSYVAQVRVRLRKQYKHLPLSAFKAVPGLLRDKQPSPLPEELTQSEVAEIIKIFQQHRADSPSASGKPSGKAPQTRRSKSPNRRRKSKTPVKDMPGQKELGPAGARSREDRDKHRELVRARSRGRDRPPADSRQRSRSPLEPDSRSKRPRWDSPIPPDYEERRQAAETRASRELPARRPDELPSRRPAEHLGSPDFPPGRRVSHSPGRRRPYSPDGRLPPPHANAVVLHTGPLSPPLRREQDGRPFELVHKHAALQPAPELPMVAYGGASTKLMDVLDDGTYTTVFLGQVPEGLTPNECVDALDGAGFKRCYDFFLFEETRKPKLGSVSINMVTRQLAELVFDRAHDIIRQWAPNLKPGTARDVRWHKHQGQEALRQHYHKFADYLEGCPGDYNLPVHKPVFFELQHLETATNRPLAVPALAGIPWQLGLQQQTQPGPQPTASEIGAPPPLAESSVFSCLQPQQMQPLKPLQAQLIPPEVQALLPPAVQAQVAEAYQRVAQAQLQQHTLQQLLASSSLPLQLSQLLQAQLLPASSQQQAAALLQQQYSLPMQQLVLQSLGQQPQPSYVSGRMQQSLQAPWTAPQKGQPAVNGQELPVVQSEEGINGRNGHDEQTSEERLDPRRFHSPPEARTASPIKAGRAKEKQELKPRKNTMSDELANDIARRLNSALGDSGRQAPLQSGPTYAQPGGRDNTSERSLSSSEVLPRRRQEEAEKQHKKHKSDKADNRKKERKFKSSRRNRADEERKDSPSSLATSPARIPNGTHPAAGQKRTDHTAPDRGQTPTTDRASRMLEHYRIGLDEPVAPASQQLRHQKSDAFDTDFSPQQAEPVDAAVEVSQGARLKPAAANDGGAAVDAGRQADKFLKGLELHSSRPQPMLQELGADFLSLE